MFANTFQSGFVSIFYSVGSNPLMLWDKQVKNGHIRRVVDDEVRSLVLEISGTNVATTYITCPIKPRLSLGIKLPFLVMIIKNMKKYFTFEIQILDDKDMHRRFRVSNFQSTTKVRPFCTTMPIGLSSGWNQVQFNLADFTKRAYGSTYLETTRVQIHANVRIRRIYFSDMLYTDEELPNEYKLFVPTPGMPAPPRPSKTEKKESIAKKKPSQVEAPQEGVPTEGEPPPPSPAVEEMPPPTPMAESEAPTESENLAEPPSEKLEETVTEDLTTAEPTTTTLTEGEGEAVETVEGAEGEQVPVEQAAQEGELKVEGVEIVGEAPAETPGEAPAESPAEAPAESVGEAPDKKISVAPPAETEAEVPKEGEAVVVEETPVEVEAPQEAAPSVTEEAPAESPAVEEPAPEQEAAEAT